jgi:hypothetical protein
MVDMPYAMHAQICSCVLVTTLVSWSELGEPATSSLLLGTGLFEYRQMLESNVRVLQHLRLYMQVDLLLESATQALKRFDKMTEQTRVASETEAEQAENQNPRQFSLNDILNPLGAGAGEAASLDGLWHSEFHNAMLGYPTFLEHGVLGHGMVNVRDKSNQEALDG